MIKIKLVLEREGSEPMGYELSAPDGCNPEALCTTAREMLNEYVGKFLERVQKDLAADVLELRASARTFPTE